MQKRCVCSAYAAGFSLDSLMVAGKGWRVGFVSHLSSYTPEPPSDTVQGLSGCDPSDHVGVWHKISRSKLPIPIHEFERISDPES